MAVTKGQGNPDWTEDETVLALDLYVANGRKTISRNDPRVIALSDLLQRMPWPEGTAKNDRFRNVEGVTMKVLNLRSLDLGRGLRNTVMDRAAWTKYGDKPDLLAERAAQIRAAVPIPREAPAAPATELMAHLRPEHIAQAIARLDGGVETKFAESTKYDLAFNGRRYPPKRVVGLALELLTGSQFGPDAFSGGEASTCFRTLQRCGYAVVPKADGDVPNQADRVLIADEEVSDFEDLDDRDLVFEEGRILTAVHRKRERDPSVRRQLLRRRRAEGKLCCEICEWRCEVGDGKYAEAALDAHHVLPLSMDLTSRRTLEDFALLCANCHRLVHRAIADAGVWLSIPECRKLFRGTLDA